MFKKTYLILYMVALSINIEANAFRIEIDVSQQRLYVINNDKIEISYPISSSEYGEGSIENSFKTPLGRHVIREKIGQGADINTIFTSRIDTTRQAEVIEKPIKSNDDFVTSRIMWLDGEEPGLNKGGKVDSYRRYIYIHGTHEEGLIGAKASHGCIRMFNSDVIELYDLVRIGTKVLIKA